MANPGKDVEINTFALEFYMSLVWEGKGKIFEQIIDEAGIIPKKVESFLNYCLTPL